MEVYDKINNAVEKFHDKFYPEGIVEFLGSSEDGKLAFEFSGHMCLTCGVEDYFEDFREILTREMGEEYIIYKKEPLDDEHTAWVVIYAPKKLGEAEEYRVKYLVVDPVKEKEEEVVL